jgi:hypothetical protein
MNHGAFCNLHGANLHGNEGLFSASSLSQVLARSQICVTAVVPSGQTVFADDCKAEGVGNGVESSRRKHCWNLEANKLPSICRRSSAPSQHVEYFVHPSKNPPL